VTRGKNSFAEVSKNLARYTRRNRDLDLTLTNFKSKEILHWNNQIKSMFEPKNTII